jgi:ABC-type phosphate/phosphonate transport system ATPase subunit
LADEPVSHLDDGNGEQMGQLIAEEAARQGAAVIVTSIGKHIPLDYDKTIKL